MKTMFRGLLVSGLTVATLAAGLVGCSTEQVGGEADEIGELGLPLASYGPSGVRYRLRDAQFSIGSDYYGGWAGSGSSQPPPTHIVVSSEEDPDSDSISVPLEQGSYNVTLQPGWRLEKLGPNGAETVEATLLSSESAYVYVSPRSTTWAEFHFGIGERSLWLNGELNINIRVSEDPADDCGYYGSGAGGYWGGGCGTGGAAGFGNSGGFSGGFATGGSWSGTGGGPAEAGAGGESSGSGGAAGWGG